jgi:prepilin-type processing-associated H-X9-DG protein
MGTAWVMYISDSKGRLPYDIWHQNPRNYAAREYNEFIWHGFWFGMLGDYRVSSSKLLCPEAVEPVPAGFTPTPGAGTAFAAWSGKYQNASPVGILLDPVNSNGKINATQDASKLGYRVGSYGFNSNVHFSKGADDKYTDVNNNSPDDGTRYPATPPSATGSSKAYFGANIAQVKPSTEVPLFYDSVWIDNQGMVNGSPTQEPNPPPDLGGGAAPKSSDYQWRFQIARHGRAINVCFVDGHAQRVALEDTYKMKWTPYWNPYPLKRLPKK